MEIGYARVSTLVQTVDLQTDALTQAGCELTFTDTSSGAKAGRTGLAEALSHVRPGDTLVVWRLDRLGRTLPHLIQTVEDLKARGVGFRSLTESIDTTTSAGQLIFHIFGALAEFERNLIRERTQAGLVAARARGHLGGRRRLLNAKQIAQARTLYADRNNSIADICRTLKISRTTLWRYLQTDAPARA
jgi:DNA invertase Pin-like site-specific DNA recombinase